MNSYALLLLALTLTFGIGVSGCSRPATAKNPEPIELSPPEVESEHDGVLVRVDHPEQFPTVVASAHSAATALNVTGVVTADVSRNIPVVSVASGRIIEIRARLGDTVRKGQVLMRVQSADVTEAFSAYRQAVADEKLSLAQLSRSKVLYEKGAIARKDLEVAQEAEEKWDVVVEAAAERLRVLGADTGHPAPTVDILAPADGVITDQQVTAAAGTQGLASPGAFTISDLSRVWVICDVHENDLASIAVGEPADIRLNAFPNRLLHGTISNIGAVLDPTMRTAKVRIEVENSGIMRLGMFVRAEFRPRRGETHGVVPSSAVLHLHDRDWVYVPHDAHTFRRVEVFGGPMLPPDRQEILSGIRPGDRVVANVLLLDSTSSQ
jgi:cobalt-zinc-cadmium efflux system membrane fusion protein